MKITNKYAIITSELDKINKDLLNILFFIKKIAEFEGITVSELVRKIISEKLEDMYDIQLADEAYEEYEKDKVTYSLDEVKKLLNL